MKSVSKTAVIFENKVLFAKHRFKNNKFWYGPVYSNEKKEIKRYVGSIRNIWLLSQNIVNHSFIWIGLLHFSIFHFCVAILLLIYKFYDSSWFESGQMSNIMTDSNVSERVSICFVLLYCSLRRSHNERKQEEPFSLITWIRWEQ